MSYMHWVHQNLIYWYQLKNLYQALFGDSIFYQLKKEKEHILNATKELLLSSLLYCCFYFLIIISPFAFSPILLSNSDLKRNPEIPYLFLLFFFSLPFKVKNTFTSMRYKSFITDKTRQDENEPLQKFPKELLER